MAVVADCLSDCAFGEVEALDCVGVSCDDTAREARDPRLLVDQSCSEMEAQSLAAKINCSSASQLYPRRSAPSQWERLEFQPQHWPPPAWPELRRKPSSSESAFSDVPELSGALLEGSCGVASELVLATRAHIHMHPIASDDRESRDGTCPSDPPCKCCIFTVYFHRCFGDTLPLMPSPDAVPHRLLDHFVARLRSWCQSATCSPPL
jgi:hypothetical protein